MTRDLWSLEPRDAPRTVRAKTERVKSIEMVKLFYDVARNLRFLAVNQNAPRSGDAETVKRFRAAWETSSVSRRIRSEVHSRQ